jgi:flagellar motor protein MotB
MGDKEPIKEDAPPGVPAWMLTFCDCMTLLLTFFVLLLSFSSFDEATQRRLNGAMQFRPAPSVSTTKSRMDNAIAIEIQPPTDLTAKGSEKKSDDKMTLTRDPKKAKPPPDTDDYMREMVLSIPIGKLFVGDTTVLTPTGRDGLVQIASYLSVVPCYVIIGESQVFSRSREANALGMERSWMVLQCIKQRKNLPAKRFWLAGECPRPRWAKKEKPAMQIVLLAKNQTQ